MKKKKIIKNCVFDDMRDFTKFTFQLWEPPITVACGLNKVPQAQAVRSELHRQSHFVA